MRLHAPDPLDEWDEPDAHELPPPAPTHSRAWWLVRRLLWWATLALAALLPVAIAWLALTAPLSRSLKPVAPPAITLLAADGSLLARRGAVVAAPVDVRRLPPHVPQAFLAIEDRRFYHHGAIDPRGILRAAYANLRAGGVREGGSTITQQLAKLVFLSADRTAARKAKEMLIAFWLEAWLSKDEILSRYLSEAYYGDNVYGLRAAARHYFDTAPERLTVAQAALLAGLMKAPSRLAPTANPAGAAARARLVVAAMAQAGFLSPARAAAVTPARLSVVPVPEPVDGGWFADWVLPAARGSLGDDAAGGDPVRTTLEPRLQRAAEAAVARGTPAGAEVALVAMRPDGRVVAMVGGRPGEATAFNRATQARRQPGSTFKLFAYLAALRAGMTPDSKVEDRPVTVNGWSPANADGRYRGSITLREAFARSSNVAAVRLTQQVGPAAVVRAARDLGIVSPLAADPSVALGTAGVTLLELDAAYAAAAGGAAPVRPRGIAAAPEGWLQRLWRTQAPLPADQRRMLLDLLAAPVRQGTARAAALSVPVYGKTGTSQNNRDALFVGFAGGLVTAVWIGRDDDRSLGAVAGGGAPARIWAAFTGAAIGARPAGAPVPRAVDPDAGGFQFDIGNLSVGLAIGRDGLHLHATPREGSDEDEPDDDDDAR